MSLLEDVFLEDEAGEAQELERVIEGDELDERPRTPDSNEDIEKEDEAEEDKRVVDHTAKAKRVVKNPRFVLNPARLTGPRGIQVIPEHFKDFKFKGKGHECEDLDFILKKLEHWAYRLYPKFKFDDCLKKIETLGRKRPVMVHLHKIRTDQILSEETVQQQDSSGDEAAQAPQEEDEFDRLLQQQIELARSTPAPSSVRKETHTPMPHHISPLMVTKVSSSPSISDEQKERIIKNRKLAEERRLARLNHLNNTATVNGNTSTQPNLERAGEVNMEKVDVNDAIVINDDIDIDIPVVRKLNRTNVIESDSSDDENEVLAVNESVTVDVHSTVPKDVENMGNHSDKENTELEVMAVDKSAVNEVVTVNVHNTFTLELEVMAVDKSAVNEVVTVNVHNTFTLNGNTSTEPIPKRTEEVNMEKAVVNDVENKDENSDKGNTKLDAMAVDVLTVNEAITVDEHVLKDVENIRDNADKGITELEAIEPGEEISINAPIDIVHTNKSSKNINGSVTKADSKGPATTENNFNDKSSEDTSNSDIRVIVLNNSIVKENETIPSSMANQSEEVDKKDNDSVTEELMDVDFSDDF